MDLPAIEKNRPTITLAMIVKNEERNMDRLLDSVEGCFDEIVIADTGSTDRTKEICEKRGCKVYDFEWVNSFSKARNFAFSKATMDFVMWLDADDVLHDKADFIKWRDHAMRYVDCWLNTYEYAVDENRKPIIAFMRERVFRRSINPTWQYDLHEGIIMRPEWSRSYATTWVVKHLRTQEDMAQDKSRNVTLLEQVIKSGKADARMEYYFGKELYEAHRPNEALAQLEKALEMNLEGHDRVLALQYAGYAATALWEELKPDATSKKLYFNKALDFALQGLALDPNRAEFHVAAGDLYLRDNRLVEAVPYFQAAKYCLKNFNTPYEGAVYSYKNCYGELPQLQLAKIYAHIGLLDKAKEEAEGCIKKFKNAEAQTVLDEVNRVHNLVTLENNQVQTDDIVFSCPPQSAYEFDEELYKTKGMGGSETALIEMAKHLKAKTGRPVKVFAMRKEKLVGDSGVEYIPNGQMVEYLSKNHPHTHIAWRHNIKLTTAPTYLWCHDLSTQGVETERSFDKMLCLTEFHKDYVMGLQGVPGDEIIVTRNGIDPKKFDFGRPDKNPNKFVWMSSPDRGLDRAIAVVEQVRKEFPEAELHVYYGIEGLYKYGPAMSALADRLKSMMAERSWVKYHGFTEQNQMYRSVADAVIWIHPCNFIETFCITALEMQALGIFPVTRRLGALQNTLAEAEQNRAAILLDHDCVTEEQIKAYANSCCRVILNKQWENVKLDLEKNSWASIADEWIETMNLSKPLDTGFNFLPLREPLIDRESERTI